LIDINQLPAELVLDFDLPQNILKNLQKLYYTPVPQMK